MTSGLRGLANPPNASMNVSASRICKEILSIAEPDWVILNLGSGTRFRYGFNNHRFAALRSQVVNLELTIMPNVDITADGHSLPFKADSFHLVINQAVLEHVRDPEKVVLEMIRVLRPGGYLYVEVPFLQGYHPTPTDYRRFTEEGMRQLLSDLVPIEIGVCAGPTSALANFLREYAKIPFDNPRLSRLAFIIAGWMVFPLKYLDLALNSREKAAHLASALYFWGRKTASSPRTSLQKTGWRGCNC